MPFASYKNFDECVSKNQSKANPKAYCASIMRKVEGKKEQADFCKIEHKEEDGEFYTRGYIATTHLDSDQDMIQKETLEKWAEEINSTTDFKANPVSIHHERGDTNLAGLGKQASVEKLEDGEYGLWVETHHNKTHPDHKDTVYQIDNDFLTHYSIEYDTNEDSTGHRENQNGNWVRINEPNTKL